MVNFICIHYSFITIIEQYNKIYYAYIYAYCKRILSLPQEIQVSVFGYEGKNTLAYISKKVRGELVLLYFSTLIFKYFAYLSFHYLFMTKFMMRSII